MLTYGAIKEDPEELIRLLKNHQRRDGQAYYYEVRNLDRDPGKFGRMTGTEKAARMIFLNRTCYNGLYRVNSRGFFNVPRGRYKNPVICDEAALREISGYLNSRQITILNTDFEQGAAGAGDNSLVYFDPPYHSPGKTGFTAYQPGGFAEEEQERLRDLMLELTRRGARCLLSNSDTPYIRALYRHELFEIITIGAKRPINSDTAGRGTVNEVLVRNWKG